MLYDLLLLMVIFLVILSVTYRDLPKIDLSSSIVFNHLINTYHAGFAFTEQHSFHFLEFQRVQRLIDELINQNQTWLYLFECMYHGDSK